MIWKKTPPEDFQTSWKSSGALYFIRLPIRLSIANMFIFHNIILPNLRDIIKVIDTNSIAKHNNTKKLIKFITTKGEEFSRKLIL